MVKRGAEPKQEANKMAKSYESKDLAEKAVKDLDCDDCFSAVFISSHYAKFDGLEGDKWYVISNSSRKVI